MDVLPVDAEALARGFIVWPESGIRMSVVGFRHVFSRATRLHEGRHSIRVADLATLALLKVVSYLDRPQDRQRDLGDIAHIWEGYLPEDDTRRFDAGALEAGIPFDAETSFLLGRDLGGMVNENEAGAVESLLRSLADDTPARAQILSDSPLSWRRNEDELELRLRAFGLGFADGRRRLSEDTE